MDDVSVNGASLNLAGRTAILDTVEFFFFFRLGGRREADCFFGGGNRERR